MAKIQPIVTKRMCGGWLAVTPESESLRIGVTAETEEGAREKYGRSLDRWRELLATETLVSRDT